MNAWAKPLERCLVSDTVTALLRMHGGGFVRAVCRSDRALVAVSESKGAAMVANGATSIER